MVQIPTVKKENTSLEDILSWKDFQGLSWILSDDFESENKIKNVCVSA